MFYYTGISKDGRKPFNPHPKWGYLSPQRIKALEDDDPNLTVREMKTIIARLKTQGKMEAAEEVTNKLKEKMMSNPEGKYSNADSFVLAGHTVSRPLMNSILQVDGLSIGTFRALYDDSFHTTASHIRRIMADLRKAGKDNLAAQVELRHAATLEAVKNNYIEKHNLQHIQGIIEEYKMDKVNGLPLGLFRALYDPNYIPQKSRLKVWIKQFEASGEFDKIKILEDKYDKLLFSDEPQPSVTAEEADEYMQYIKSDQFEAEMSKILEMYQNTSDADSEETLIEALDT